MSAPSLIFYGIFVIPLIVFLIWLLKQDKRKGWIGLIALAVTVIGALLWMAKNGLFA
ncbi:hypothetical protein ACFQZS_10815 [Mucilaginibacter calamicampi]|uniref:Phospholipase D-like protein n=1 Tax=Mucilaginibacter calamicampi TaxID=1302352 RepID=A0ABW2YVY7_9SPHI